MTQLVQVRVGQRSRHLSDDKGQSTLCGKIVGVDIREKGTVVERKPGPQRIVHPNRIKGATKCRLCRRKAGVA